MKVSWNQFNDVGEPVLADRSDNVHRNLIVNVLTVALVGNLAGLDSALVSTLRVHDGFILLASVCWLHIFITDYVELRAGVIDVLVLYAANVGIDVEAFTTRCEVSAYAMAHREVVALGADRGSQGPAERVDHRRESAHRFRGPLEAHGYELAWVVGDERELLVLCHGIITCTEEIRGNFSFTMRLLEASGGRVILGAVGRFETAARLILLRDFRLLLGTSHHHELLGRG